MIQRIQSVWLLISSLTPLYFIKGAIAKFKTAGEGFYVIGFKGINLLSGSGVESIRTSIAIPVAIILIAVLSLAAFFMFKNRRLQKIATLVVFAFSSGLLIMTIFHSWQIISQYDAVIQFVPGLLVPPLLCLASLMAWKGISRDEALVRSYDRLR